MRKTLEFLRTNPVLLLDILKYVLAGLLIFGVPIPSGLDVILAGLLVSCLSVMTRALVVPASVHAEAVAVALATTPPAEPVTAPANVA